MSENEYNVRDSKNALINYLINYLTNYKSKSKNKERRTTTIRLDPQIYYQFIDACMFFGVRPFNGTNVIIEGLMSLIVENFGNKPRVIQTTLFYKPTIIQQNHVINISLKLQIKMIRQELENILKSLEQHRGDPSFYMQKLRKTVEKASRLYESTRDPQLEMLLERAEKWI